MRRSGSLKLYVGIIALGLSAISSCNGWNGLEIEEGNLVSPNGAITQAGDEARTGWYPDQPGLDPAIVGGANFGRLFKTPLPLTPGEQVLAQPLVYNGKVLVVTEANNLYLLDAISGAVTNQRALGGAYNASGAMGCGDIVPTVGITGTPVIDASSGTAYFYSKSSAGVWTFHAIDAGTLAERAGFPVTLAGTAQNEPTQTFNGANQHQRPGLLLMNGVVYAGFGAHCDIDVYRGWIVGVSTTGQLKALFSTVKGTGANGRGAGVWQSGGGLMSDGAGQIVFSTGNGYTQNAYPNAIPTNTDPGYLIEAIARVTVQADGTLKTTDAFIPYNYGMLDGNDADLGSGGVVALPAQFGTASVPRLAMVSGKGGTFYLLNRDHLGGHKQGANGGDAVLAAVDLGGSTWNRPAAWPGDGGYMYVMTNGGTSTTGFRLQAIKYATDAQGLPTASVAARAPENFGSYSGSPIVTSNGTASGSALVWATNNTSELRAYDAVPAGGNLTLRFHDAYGNQAKFTTIGVGAGRVYVGSGDGFVIGYGSTSLPAVSGGPVDFGTVIIGQSKPLTVTLTANQNMTVQAFSTTSGVYTVGAGTPALPNAMTAGQTMTVPVTFTPTAAGSAAANLTVTTSAGNELVTLTGVGQVNGPKLVATPANLTFGGVATGASKSLTVVLQNTGNQTLTFSGLTAPAAPFSASGVPASGATLAAGASTTATVTMTPTTDGTWSSSLVVNSDGGNVSVALTGTSGAPPLLQITPLTVTYGTVAAGAASVMTFAVKNVGGTDLMITKSKPPALGQFVATTALDEGAVITAGQTVTESVTFSSATAGTFNDVWVITGNDTTGVQNVQLTATAVAPVSRTGWVASSSATAGDPPAQAIDGNMATRFSSGTAMVPGQWFQVDMLTAKTFGMLTMDSGGSVGDYAHGYQVFVSNDGVNFGAAVATGTASTQLVTVSFTPQTARYVRVVQTQTVTPNWWSIHEFNVYGGGAPPPAPQPPSGLTATAASSASINLTWAASPTSGVSYSVFRATTSGFTPGAGNQVASGVTALAYADTGLAASTTYYYVVEAIGAGGASVPSNQANATTQASQTLTALPRTGWVASAQPVSAADTAAKAIDGLAASRFASGTAQVPGQWFQVDMLAAQSFSRVVLDATASAGDYARGYQVFVSTDGAGWGTAVASGTGTGAVITVDFAPQTKRYVRVVQMGTVTPNWWSIHEFNVYGSGTQPPPAPNPPTGLAATAASTSAINLSWTASTTSGVTYSVFRATTSGFTPGAGNQIATGLTGLTYASSGLTASTTYYYVVRANNAGGASASSNQASATTQAAGGTGPQLLSRTGWVASASATGGTDVPAQSLDGVSTTRWSAGVPQVNGQWFQLDLGAARTFDQLVIESGADYARGYQVFVSDNGTSWGTAVATGTGTGATTSVSFALQTKRYVRVVQTGTSTAWWSIYEVNLWNNNGAGAPVAYGRTGWTAAASSSAAASPAANTLDGVTTTRWSSGAAQANGQWFQLDLGVAQPFVQLVMDSTGSAADYARGYQVFASNDGATWGTAIASGTPTGPVVTVSFAPQTKRYIRIVQTGTATSWWSMHEVNVLHY